jgi:hypothetical protein
VPNGSYTVNLKFAEVSMSAAGQRVFNVAIDGAAVLSNFDIFARAGGALRALDQSFPVTVTNGQIVVTFSTGAADWPLVNGIEVTGGTPPPGGGSSFTPIRVNAGGGAFTDPSNNTWSADTGFNGGNAYSTGQPIANTATPALYQTCRWGAFTYQYAVPNGSYTVNLKFAEVSMSAAGQRVFNVAINGAAVLTNFDIFARAGGALRALDETFPVNVTGGQIAISFSAGTADWPLVNGIEILSAGATSSGTIVLARVNAGGSGYTDPAGNVWSADTGFNGGNPYSTGQPIANTSSPGVYQTCRWGAFSYQFSAPNGSYMVTLKFAEVSMSAAGQRVFNVAINGAPVLTNFDIFTASGGALRALDKSFPVTVTGGQIVISFTAGTADWPLVNGLEIDGN